MSQFDPGTARFLTQGLQAGLSLGMEAEQLEMQRQRQRMFEQQAAEEARMRLRQREANKRLTDALFSRRGASPTVTGGQLAAAVTPQPQFASGLSGAPGTGPDAFASMMRGGYPAPGQQGGAAASAGGVGAASGAMPGAVPQMDPLDAVNPDDVADADPRFQQAYFNAKADRQSSALELAQTQKLYNHMTLTGLMRAASPAMIDRFMSAGFNIPEHLQPPWMKAKMVDENKQRAADMIVMLREIGAVEDDSQPSLLGGVPAGMQVPGAGLNRRRYKMSELQGKSPELLEMLYQQAVREKAQADKVGLSRMEQEAELRLAQQEATALVAEARQLGVDPQLYLNLTPAQRGQFALGRMDPKSSGAPTLTPAAEVAFYRQRFEDVAGKDKSPPTPNERKMAALDPDKAYEWKIMPGVSRESIMNARAKVETFDAWIAAVQKFAGGGQPQDASTSPAPDKIDTLLDELLKEVGG